MDLELLSQAKRAEIEREVAYLRLLAAAEAAKAVRDGQAAAASAKKTVADLPGRLLQALRSGS